MKIKAFKYFPNSLLPRTSTNIFLSLLGILESFQFQMNRSEIVSEIMYGSVNQILPFVLYNKHYITFKVAKLSNPSSQTHILVGIIATVPKIYSLKLKF